MRESERDRAHVVGKGSPQVTARREILPTREKFAAKVQDTQRYSR